MSNMHLVLDSNGIITIGYYSDMLTAHNTTVDLADTNSELEKMLLFGKEKLTAENFIDQNGNVKEKYQKYVAKYQTVAQFAESMVTDALTAYICVASSINALDRTTFTPSSRKGFESITGKLKEKFGNWEGAFKKERKDLEQKSNQTAYYNLHPAYEGIVEGTRRLVEEGNYRIAWVVTSKDKNLVYHLIVHYGLADIIPEDHVIEHPDKVTSITNIAEQLQIPLSQISVIDDGPGKFKWHSDERPNLFTATWGHIDRRREEEFSKQGWYPLQLQDYYTALRNIAERQLPLTTPPK